MYEPEKVSGRLKNETDVSDGLRPLFMPNI